MLWGFGDFGCEGFEVVGFRRALFVCCGVWGVAVRKLIVAALNNYFSFSHNLGNRFGSLWRFHLHC